MTQVTVKQLADEVKTPVERLLQQMREAGLPHTAAEQNVTDSEKQALLTHLKSSHKAKVEEPRKITLQRKTTSTLRVAGSKSISVEVRKKKVFVQRSPEEIEAERKRELDSSSSTIENVDPTCYPVLSQLYPHHVYTAYAILPYFSLYLREFTFLKDGNDAFAETTVPLSASSAAAATFIGL